MHDIVLHLNRRIPQAGSHDQVIPMQLPLICHWFSLTGSRPIRSKI